MMKSRAIAMPKQSAWVWDVRIVSGDEVIENLRKPNIGARRPAGPELVASSLMSYV
jgi:hypothetical protein